MQWCLSNIGALTTRKFYEKYGHKYSTICKVKRRYSNIINPSLKGKRLVGRIQQEFKQWSESKHSKDFWRARIQLETLNVARVGAAKLVQRAVKAEVQTVSEAFQHIPQSPEQDQVETDSSEPSSSNEPTE